MLEYREWQETLLYFNVQPKGPIPSVNDEDGIYPYESYCQTASRPILKKLKMVTIENDFISVTVCPDLGGRVESIFDKKSGREILFKSGCVRPVRILPRMAFISGGIEVSFPISHTPSQIEKVHYHVKKIKDRVYIWCGEREIRYGMQWTVEFSLGEKDRFLTQRTCFYNPTGKTHEWMSWSNAALPAMDDSEFYFPSGVVLRHADILETTVWEKNKKYKLSDFDRMEGYFWRTTDCNAFGMFNPSLGIGLYHIADQKETCGIKLWLYGKGRHETWAHQTAYGRESYVEIQAGPIREQADKALLNPGELHCHKEFWIPAVDALSIYELELPEPELIDVNEIPLYDFVLREKTRPWLELLNLYKLKFAGKIPEPPEAEGCFWPPSGMEDLDEALKWAADNSEGVNKSLWYYYLGVYYAGCGRIDESVEVLSSINSDWSNAFLGRLLRTEKKDYAGSLEALNKILSPAWQLHPQVIVERDITLSHLGEKYFSEREKWLNKASALDDEELIERRAYLLYEKGEIEKAYEILKSVNFQKIHQRYKRTELWNLINKALGTNEPVPESLGEDDLAAYGAYRAYNNGVMEG